MAKRRRRKSFPWLFILLVLVPTILGVMHYYKYATPQYVSEARFIIQGNDAPRIDLLGSLTGIASGGAGASDTSVIRDYLQSLDFLDAVQERVDIRKHYSSREIDAFARLVDKASREEWRDYWQNQVEVEHELSAGITTVKVTAFEPEISQRLVNIALDSSERLVNDLSSKLREDALQLAQQEADKAVRVLDQARAATTRFRETQDIIDPVQQAGGRIERAETARLQVVSQLRSQLATAEAELARLRTFMQPQALQVRTLQSQVNALRQQIQREQTKNREQSRGTNRAVAKQLSQYAELQSREAFAQQVYQAKLASLEQARLDFISTQRYLTVIIKPSLPDEAVKPDRLMGALTVFLLSFLGWGISSLSIAAIRDHVGWL